MVAAKKLSPKEIVELHHAMLVESDPKPRFLTVFFLAIAVAAMWLCFCLLTSAGGPDPRFTPLGSHLDRVEAHGF